MDERGEDDSSEDLSFSFAFSSVFFFSLSLVASSTLKSAELKGQCSDELRKPYKSIVTLLLTPSHR